MNYPKGVEEYISLSNYKAPFQPAKDGYGADGVQEMHVDKQKILCKECGEFYKTLASHLKVHDTNEKDYKDKFNLRRTTALIGEGVREQRIKTAMKTRLGEIGTKALKDVKRGKPKTIGKARKEYQNQKGTCYDQVLDKIISHADKLGRTPTKEEFLQVAGVSEKTVIARYGSWNKALKIAGLKINKAANRMSKEYLAEAFDNFVSNHDRLPTKSDYLRGLIPDRLAYGRQFGIEPSYFITARMFGYNVEKLIQDLPRQTMTRYKKKYQI